MNPVSVPGLTAISRQTPLFSGRSFAVFVAIAVLWTVLAWFAVERQVQDRATALVLEHTRAVQQAVVVIGANMDRVFNRLQGLAAVLAGVSDVKSALAPFGPGAGASPIAYESRKADWTRHQELSALSRQLRAATEDVGVDILWVMNAGGDCVAASNAAAPMSFVGTNYADRAYFRSVQDGKRGRQFAVGRVTKVPGLFFSAPVIAHGRFVGAVAVKSDLPRIASAVNHPDAFVTDDFGVIILAADQRLEMRALPGAAVHQLSDEQRLSRYLRSKFDTLDTGTASGPGGLLRVSGSPHPHVAARSELTQHGITVHILMPMRDIDGLRGPALITFLLLAASGILLSALVFGVRVWVARAREYRRSIEARNESLNELNVHLENLATRDPLTGLYNRRIMDASLEREVVRARRKQAPLAVIMIDVDHFKRFNDRFGHKEGDAVLQAMGKLLKRQVRGSDVACRYGGEEFIVVMPETPLEAARARAEALRLAVHRLEISGEYRAKEAVTISLGLAVLPQHAATAAGLISAADSALYEAKESGRDRLAVCGEGGQAGTRAPEPVAEGPGPERALT